MRGGIRAGLAIGQPQFCLMGVHAQESKRQESRGRQGCGLAHCQGCRLAHCQPGTQGNEMLAGALHPERWVAMHWSYSRPQSGVAVAMGRDSQTHVTITISQPSPPSPSHRHCHRRRCRRSPSRRISVHAVQPRILLRRNRYNA
jgi:hypothetical protein